MVASRNIDGFEFWEQHLIFSKRNISFTEATLFLEAAFYF